MVDDSVLFRIGALIKAKRKEKNLGLRAAARESGLSPSTLSRLERGKSSSLPDADTLRKVADWLGVSIGQLLVQQEQPEVAKLPALDMPEIVEVHLRADKRLTPKTAQALARMFRTLYNEFSEVQKAKDANR